MNKYNLIRKLQLLIKQVKSKNYKINQINLYLNNPIILMLNVNTIIKEKKDNYWIKRK